MRPITRAHVGPVRLAVVLLTLSALFSATGSAAPALAAGSAPTDGFRAAPVPAIPGARPNQESGPTSLGVIQVEQMAVDDAHQHVFLSAPANSELVVMNFDGSLDTTITGLTDPRGMTLDAASHTLYVAETEGHAIQAVDTNTLTLGTSWPLGTCPGSVRLTAGRLWFSYFCNVDPYAEGIGSLDPGTGTVTLTDRIQGECCWTYLGVDPSTPNVLYAAAESCPPYLTKLDVSAATPTLLDSWTDVDCSAFGSMNGMMAVPGHSQLVTVSEPPDGGAATWKTSDLTPDTLQYATAGIPIASATTSDGDWVAVGAGNTDEGTAGIDILVSAQGSDTPWSGFASEDGATSGLQVNGLVFSGDASRLFVVTRDIDSWGLLFNVLDRPTDPGSFLDDVTIGPDGVKTAEPLTFSGTLRLADGASPADKALRVKRVNPDGSISTLPDITTDDTGHFSLTQSVGIAGAYTYKAIWDGDTTHTGTRALADIDVDQGVKSPGTLSISVSKTGVAYQGSVTVTAYLQTPVHPGNHSVTITSVSSTGGTNTISGTLDKFRKFSHTYKLSRTTSFHASWAGDERFDQTTSGTRKVTAGSVTKQSLSGSYAISGGYHLYHYSDQCVSSHQTGCPLDVTTVAPNNAGGQVCFSWQEYYSGAWHSGSSLCESLDGNSHAGMYLYYTGPGIIGFKTRLHVQFKGTSWNQGSTSGWVYLKVTH
jgi:hypothetical protein